MKLLTSLLLFLLTFGGTAFAGGGVAPYRNLSKYSCDVFMSTACFRLPNDMSVTYRVPADYGVYSIAESGKDLATVYAGSAPDASKFADRLAVKIDSSAHVVRAFMKNNGDSKVIDIFLTPRKDKFLSFHFQASINEGNRARIAEIVSGLRSCKKTSRENFFCPSESDVGNSLSEWVLSLTP